MSCTTGRAPTGATGVVRTLAASYINLANSGGLAALNGIRGKIRATFRRATASK